MRAHTRKSRLAWLIGITGVMVLGLVGLALGGGVITKVYSAPAEGATYYVGDVIEYEMLLGPFDIVGQTVTGGTIDATMTCPCSAEIYVKGLNLAGNEEVVLKSSGAYSSIGGGPQVLIDITAPPYNATVTTSSMATWQQLLQYTVAESDIQSPTLYVPVKHVKASLTAFGQASAVGIIGSFTVFDERDTHNPVINPSTKMTVSDLPDGGYYHKGDDVTVYFHEKNDGDEALTEVYADVYVDDVWVEKKEFIGTLEPGQTWNFDYTKTNVQADGKISAIGHGKDPLGKDITFPDFEEKAEVSYTVINPSTMVTISADSAMVYKGDEVVWTITEKNDGDVALTGPYVNLNTAEADNAGLAKLMAPPDSGDANADGILDPGETWAWEVKTNPTADVTVWAYGHGMDPLGADIDHLFDADEKASTSVKVIDPSTKVTISADPATIYSGGEVLWTITEQNNGDVALTDPYVNLNTAEADSAGLAKLMAPPTSGDANADGILDPGETWAWEVKTNPTADVTVWAYGHGMDPIGSDIDHLFDADEKASASVKVINPAIDIIKYVSVDDGATWHDANTEGAAPEAPEAGAPIKWKIVVSNPNDFEMKITGLEDIFADQTMLAGYVDTVLAPKGEPGDSFEVIYDDVAPDAGMSKMNLAKVCAVDTMIGTKEVCDEDPAWVKSPEMGGPTRTVGFWGQHFEYTKHVLEMECGGSIDLGWVTLDSIDEVMAVLNFDAIVKHKDLTPDENKILNTSRQLVAAILNECAFGTQAPLIEGVSIIDIAREKLVSGSIDEIVWIGWELDKFNNSGDEYELYGWDTHYEPTERYWGNAMPQAARKSGAAAVEWLLTELRS